MGIEQEIENLHQLNPVHRTIEISTFTAIYIAGALAVYFSASLNGVAVSAAVLTGIVMMGVAFNALGILIHEGLHGLLSRHAGLNHIISFFCGLPLGMSATAYQVTHNNHHYELGNKPDYGTYKQHFRQPVLVWTAYMLQLLFGTVFYVLLIPFIAFAAGTPGDRLFIALEYLLIATAFTVIITSLTLQAIQLYWLYPILVMSVLSNLRGLGSHALGNVENIYLSSRTIKASRLTAMLFLNENYHLEHHLFPRVPGYNLRKVHLLIWHRLPSALYSNSYPEFLAGFFKAALKNNLEPLGAIHRQPVEQA